MDKSGFWSARLSSSVQCIQCGEGNYGVTNFREQLWGALERRLQTRTCHASVSDALGRTVKNSETESKIARRGTILLLYWWTSARVCSWHKYLLFMFWSVHKVTWLFLLILFLVFCTPHTPLSFPRLLLFLTFFPSSPSPLVLSISPTRLIVHKLCGIQRLMWGCMCVRREEKESNKKNYSSKLGKLQCCFDFSGIKVKEELFVLGICSVQWKKKRLLSTSRTEDRNTSRGAVFRQQVGGIVSLFTE